MRAPPTDLKLLRTIYRRHRRDFAAFNREAPTRSSKIYVPIDIEAISTNLGVNADSVFGRLYYHLNKRHGYKQDDGSHVHFFTLKAGDDRNAVNFPLLESVLASLHFDNRKFVLATSIALLSLVFSVVSFVISLTV